MSGEFTGNGDQHYNAAQNDFNASKVGTGQEREEGYPTDVEGVAADDIVKNGKDEYPAFEVTPNEFFQNQRAERQRLRFKNGSKVGQYMRNTKNTGRPFYIKTTTKDGRKYTRKIR